jgi:AbrB family looped-hinge helix DNA binding protein
MEIGELGLITNIDANGRVQLPLTIRCLLNLRPGDKIAVDQLGDGTIILKKILGNVCLADAGMSDADMKGSVPI